MKKLLYLAVLLATIDCTAQTGYGPELGIGISNMRFAPDPSIFTASTTTAIMSGRIGGILDVAINRQVYFQPGLFVARRGNKRSFSFYVSDSLNESVDQTVAINYADLPINVIYKTGTQGKGRFFIGAGATLSYIIGGRNKYTAQGKYNDTPFVVNNDSKIAADVTFKGFDVGLNLTSGYELPSGLYFRAYYTIGSNDIGLGYETDKNRMGGISIGYTFGKGRNVKKETEDLIDRSTN